MASSLYIGGSVNPTNSMMPANVSAPKAPIRPGQETPNGPPPNVLGPQAVRPTGPSNGFDPSYLQNLATAIGGLFSRPQGNLGFNPTGNLSEVSPGTGFGNAPLPGLPSTMLQDAINGLAFMFNQPQPATSSRGSGDFTGGTFGNGNDGGRGRLMLQ